jgi:hypothetical protein
MACYVCVYVYTYLLCTITLFVINLILEYVNIVNRITFHFCDFKFTFEILDSVVGIYVRPDTFLGLGYDFTLVKSPNFGVPVR